MRSPNACNVLEIIAVDFDSEIRSHAGDQFVETHLDRLRELVVVAWNLRCRRFQITHEVLFSTCVDPATRRAAS